MNRRARGPRDWARFIEAEIASVSTFGCGSALSKVGCRCQVDGFALFRASLRDVYEVKRPVAVWPFPQFPTGNPGAAITVAD